MRSVWGGVLGLAMVLSAPSCRCSGDEAAGDASAPTGAEGTAEAAASGAPGEVPATLAVETMQLDNGMQIDLLNGACGDVATVAVLIRAGIDHDPEGRSGLARVAERVLSDWTAERKGRGVSLGSDYMLYTVRAGGDALLAELDAVAAWMARVPGEEDLARARKAVLAAAAKLDGEDAAATAERIAAESVVPVRNRGRRGGVAAEVEAITLDELKAFWAAHVTPGNSHMVVAGPLQLKPLRARVAKGFADMPGGSPAKLGAEGDATVRGTLVMGETPSAVAVAVPAPAMSDERFPAFLVLAARLLRAPEQGRDWQVRYDPVLRPELLLIRGKVGPAEQPEPAAARIRAEVDKLIAGPLARQEARAVAERFRLLLDTALLDAALCSKDPRAFAVARARRPQLKDVPGEDALAAAGERLDEARELFSTKKSASVIAGGAIR